jgi:HAD superfamily hydrolase (TIGR01509 family)
MFTLLWDNDGVLVETEGYYFEASRRVLAGVGVELTREMFQQISLREGRSTLELAAGQDASPQAIEPLRVRRDELFADLLRESSPLIPGVREVLQELHGSVRMAIVTSSKRAHFEIAHASTGVLPYFDLVLTREDYQMSKPSPEPYLTALRRMDAAPERTLVIEDSERGLAAAISAGLACLVVLSPWTRDGDFAAASRVLSSITDLPAEVRRRCGGR